MAWLIRTKTSSTPTCWHSLKLRKDSAGMKPLKNPPTKAPAKGPAIPAALAAYWSLAAESLMTTLHTSKTGLPQTDADNLIKQYGPNTLKAKQQTTALGLLLRQIKSPLVLILIFAAIGSAFLGEWTDAIIVLSVVLGSTMLGFVQEYRASNAIEKLRLQVTIKSN